MIFDKILSNPPFHLGGKIICTFRDLAKESVVLCPLSCWKIKDNWKYIRSLDDFQLCENLFDAKITKNLAITKISSYVKKPNVDWEQIEMESYDQKFIDFYKVNSKLPLRYCISEKRNAKAEDFDFEKDYVDSNRLVGSDNGFMNGGTSQGYIWNVSKQRIIKNSGLSVISFKSSKAKDNFTTWAYSNCKNGLSNKVMFGLNKKTVSYFCSIAIPQIDWEAISDHNLWKQGDYDGAVLDVMGLQWNENKDGVIKISREINLNVDWEQIEMESYDQKFIDFYKVNSKLPLKYVFKRCDNARAEDFDFEKDYVDSNRLVGSDNGFMNGGTSQGYIWNVSKQRTIRNSGLIVISFKSSKAKDNFTTWAYSNCKNGLSNKVMFGLNKKTVSYFCSIAIPQIDWEAISDHDLWKQGDYDNAVLDVMGLQWNENKDGVIKISRETNLNVDWEQIKMKSYDQKFIDFYKVNSKLPLKYVFKRCDNARAEDFDKDLDFFEGSRLCESLDQSGSGFGPNGSGYKWNYYGDPNLGACMAYIHFNCKTIKDNFCTWWYSNKKGKGLSSKLQMGLNLQACGSSCSIAIPQIDWEAISDHDLWKQGDYDGAVLDVMGLQWNENKDGVIKISREINLNVDWKQIEMESYDQKFIEFYKINSKLPLICNMTQSNYLKRANIDLDVDIIESNRLPSIPDINVMSGFHGFRKGNNLGYKANVLYQLDEVLSATCYMKTSSKKSKENFCKWAYTDNPKNLANMLLYGLHMATGSSVCNIAIPQIDWEAISDHDLWKQGDYDGAVLDVMGLQWNENKDGVIKISREINLNVDWKQIEMESYDQKFIDFYKVNSKLSKRYTVIDKPSATKSSLFNVANTFITGFRSAKDGVYLAGITYDWNINKNVKVGDLTVLKASNQYAYDVVKFTNKKETDNFRVWWYYLKKDGLSSMLLYGLNKDGGSIEAAIPQIDWEAISDHDLWKQGDYDGAVLDVMGLQWNENKDGVIKK